MRRHKRMRQISAGIIVATRELEEALLTSLQDLPVRVLFEISELPDDWPAFLERVERMRPDVVILDVTKLREPMEQVIQHIRSTKTQPAVLVLHKTKDPEAILAAFRAGAAEFLFPPFGHALKDALERVAKAKEATPDSRRHAARFSLSFPLRADVARPPSPAMLPWIWPAAATARSCWPTWIWTRA